MGASINRKIVIVAAVLVFLALSIGASAVWSDSPNSLAKGHDEVIDASKPIEAGTSLKKIPVTKRANSLGFDENSPDPPSPPTCLQLQIIDEIDLLGGAECD
jgi:hypothetical protein